MHDLGGWVNRESEAMEKIPGELNSAVPMRKILAWSRLEVVLDDYPPKNKQTDPRCDHVSCRPATHSLRLRLSRTE